MADTPPPQNSPNNNSTGLPPESSPPSSPPPASPPESSTPPPSPPPSSPPPQSPSPSPPSPSPPESTPPPQSPPQGSNASPPAPSQTTNPIPSPPPLSNSSNNTPPAPSTPTHNNNTSGGNAPGGWKTPPPPRTAANEGPAALRPPSGTPGGSSPPSDSSGSTVSIPLVAVVAVVAGIVVVIALLLLILLCRRKKKDVQMEHMQYYRDDNHAAQEGAGGGQQRSTWQNTNETTNNIPPHPAGSWAAPPPPPPPVPDTNSSVFSSPQVFSVLPPPPPPMLLSSQSNFTYEELAAATNGFSGANMLGQGGFGYVHKGVLPNGKEIAVKSLKADSGQGDREFRAEVEIISRVHHRHLVSLVGYCIAGDKRLLVYEFLPNNNLEFHLHGKGQPTMDFATRMKIALGSAKGLAYLHEDCHPCIIHRDIKSSNILLDFSFEAKLADFGLAKLNSVNYTHVSTRVMGTFGYLAPEYASSGKLTEKSDVFSFGVMLLELITGRRPVDITGVMEDSLVDWARPLCLRAIEDGNYDDLADPFLEKNFPAHEMARMVACASASIRHSAKRRPKMSQIVRALEGDVSLDDLNEGRKAANNSLFGGSSTSGVGSNASDSDPDHYADEMKRFKSIKVDGGPFPYASSEFGQTSEYGLNLSTSSSEYGSQNVSPSASHLRK